MIIDFLYFGICLKEFVHYINEIFMEEKEKNMKNGKYDSEIFIFYIFIFFFFYIGNWSSFGNDLEAQFLNNYIRRIFQYYFAISYNYLVRERIKFS